MKLLVLLAGCGSLFAKRRTKFKSAHNSSQCLDGSKNYTMKEGYKWLKGQKHRVG